MKTVSFENVRRELSDISNSVKYGKENYILTKNNKPYVGIVPVEALYLMNEILALAKKNKSVAKIVSNYAIKITDEDYKFLIKLGQNPGKMTKALKSAMHSAEDKIQF